jgi:ornithine cyclodeaminase/alanine dehydrogenase-like protein (mu-crystallin family)
VKSGTKTSERILADLVDHLRRTGTRTGVAVRVALEALERVHPGPVPPKPSDVARTIRAGAATVAAIGSGMLAGLADALGSARDGDWTELPEKDA